MIQTPIEKSWKVAPQIPTDILERFHDFTPVMAQLLYNRGIDDAETAETFLNGNGPFHNPFLLKDMEKAVELILATIDSGEPIAVYGDYDVDGISATALMSEVLTRIGAQVTPYIPDRFTEGYGINMLALDKLHAAGVKLLLTVDCGIRSISELNYAVQNLGMKVIISDHHSPGESLPSVNAVVCQKQSGDTYPETNLSGVGLALKIAQAIIQTRPQAGMNLLEWFDLAALGTVADVVPLVGENRSIVKTGLLQMRFGKRRGLAALIGVSRLKMEAISATDISFGIAPRLNAVGRIESILNETDEAVEIESEYSLPVAAQKALAILMTTDTTTAGLLAQELDDINRKRQQLTRDMQSHAELLINNKDLVLFAVDKGFSSGLVGLVAAKLTENYYRPTVVGYVGEHNTRASCRSIQEFHITRALDRCNDILIQHGGHAMAAGFTVANDNLPILIERLHEIAAETLNQDTIKPSLLADIEIPLQQLPINILKDLEQLDPIGAGNPPATFISRNVRVLNARAVGQEKTHLKLTLRDGDPVFDAIAFRQGYWNSELPEYIDIFYQIENNFFNGQNSKQLNIRDIKASA